MQIFMLPSFSITTFSKYRSGKRMRSPNRFGEGGDLQQKRIAANGCSAKAKLRKFSYLDVNPVLLQAQGDLVQGGGGNPGMR